MEWRGQPGEVAVDTAELIMAAASGEGSWTEVCVRIMEAFPGSYAAILNQSHKRKEFDFNVCAGLDKEYMQSFLQHYAFVNPWGGFWKGARNGAVLVAERDAPASQYQHTEFYADWMRKVGDYDAGVGLRLSVDDDHVLYLPVHFSVRQAHSYNSALESLMVAIRPSLHNALNIAKLVRECSENKASMAALLGHEQDIGLVVDSALKPVEINAKAEASLRASHPIMMLGGRIVFADSAAHRAISEDLVSKGGSPLGFSLKRAFVSGDGDWTVSIDRLPAGISGGLVQSRALFLLRIQDSRDFKRSFDPQLAAGMFGLSPREISVCETLSKGIPLTDAAKTNGISYEHARQVLKSVFRRTGVASQAELRLLLARL